MPVFRNILGVIFGYFIFAMGAVMLFRLTGIDPHADVALSTKALVIGGGAVFAFAGGFVGKSIASTRTLIVNIVLSLIIAGFATVSLFMSAGEHYTQLAAIFLFAPLSLLGGFVRGRSEARM